MSCFFVKTIIAILSFLFIAPLAKQKLSAATAVVTGASRGIGFSLTKQLLEENVNVIAIVRDKKSLEALSEEYSRHLQVIEADLSLPQSPLIVANAIQESTIDYLVFNAAIIEPLGLDALLDAPPSALRKILETNLLSPILLTASLGSKLTAGSRILNVSSRAGEKAYPGLGMYCTSKAGLDMFTESLQLDRPHGILVASVHPGEVDTGMQDTLRTHDAKEFPFADFFQQNLESGKLMSPTISASYLTWLLLHTTNEEFAKSKHNIYDTSHHSYWLQGNLPIPY